jgi:hypothetical protein
MAWFGLAVPVRAHAPFISQAVKIILPDGQPGEMRLLHGDGIFSPDPIRVLVIGANGRLLARSHQSQTMVLSCSRDSNCRAFDVQRQWVLEIDPEEFREGPVVPFYGNELWAIEGGDESWGFRFRPASLAERVEGELALANELTLLLVPLFAAGGFVAISGLVVFRRRPEFKVMDAVKILSALVLFVLAGFISLLSTIILPVTGLIVLGSIGAGLAFVMAVRCLFRMMRIKLYSPSPAA